MTHHDDYLNEMPGTGITELDAEMLLSRSEPPDADYSDLTSALGRFEVGLLEIRLDDHAGRVSLRAATLAREAQRAERVGWARRLTPRLATAALTAVVLGATTGVAIASDASAPGDALYGIDRAVEQIGLNAGGIQERINEAGVIANRGQAVAALNHLADSLGSESEEAVDALHEATQVLAANANSQEVHASLTEMFEWMATTDATGRDFGQGVAERARALGKTKDTNGESGLKPDKEGKGGNGNNGNGNGPPGGVPPGQVGR